MPVRRCCVRRRAPTETSAYEAVQLLNYEKERGTGAAAESGTGDKCLRDTLIFMERTSEKSCKITLPVILQLSLSSVIFLSYYGKWAHAPADRHRPVLQPYSSSAAGEFSGKKRAGIDPVIRGVLV